MHGDNSETKPTLKRVAAKLLMSLQGPREQEGPESSKCRLSMGDILARLQGIDKLSPQPECSKHI